MKTKAIIIDLDGTAVDSPQQKLPSPRLVQAVERLQENYYVCSATGRVWSYAKPVLKKLQLTDPCIISAGTQICDPVTGKILWQKTLSNEALTEALRILKQYPDYKLLSNDCTEDDYFFGGTLPKDFMAVEPVYFLEQKFIPSAVAGEIYRQLQTVAKVACVMVTAQKPGTKDLHIINNAATKEYAIGELLQKIDVKKADAIGIGDGENDGHLFNAVGYKVAMGNAVIGLKSHADEIIGDIKEDGLAVYFEKLLSQLELT